MKIVGPGVFVCQSVCLSKHFGEQRPNGWFDRDRGGTDGRADPPERRWRRSRVGRRHVARGTCRCVKVYQKFLAHLQVKRGAPQSRNTQVIRIPPQLECFWGCCCCGVQAARARGGKLF